MILHYLIIFVTFKIAFVNYCEQRSLETNSNKEFEEIQFELIRNQIIFQVEVGGKTLNMMLDTGGNPSLIDAKIAHEFNWIDTTKWGYASGVGEEKIKIYLARIENIEMESLKYDHISAVAMDLGRISEKLEVSLSGILGYSFLENKIIQIDYPNKKLRIFSQETRFEQRTNSTSYHKFNLEYPYKKTIPLIRGIKINNYETNVTIDTGSNIDLDIKSYLLDSLEIDRNSLVDGEKILGASGEENVSQTQLKSVELGEIIVRGEILATVINDDNPESNKIGINIGNGILKEFMITFDYINEEVIFEKYLN